MYKRLIYLLSTYLIFTALFILETPVFMLYHWGMSARAGLADCLQAVVHGIPMDLSVAGYCTILPALLLLASVFAGGRICAGILKIYFLAVSLFIAVIFISDMELYTFWRFRIDATVLAYITSPSGVVAGISLWAVAGLAIVATLWMSIRYYFLNRWVAVPLSRLNASRRKITEPVFILLLMGVMFVAIRGGVTTSTMNVGRVYFSENMYLNHAAINPVFSVLSSITKVNKNFDKQYNFMPEAEAGDIFRSLMFEPSPPANIPQHLNTTRPNIVIVLLESFGAKLMQPLGGLPGVTPNLNRLSDESLFFRKMYANSFRTDRGLLAVLGGYPAQTNMSIIKYPKKNQHLESIPATLSKNGYHTSFLYGGDVDFAYMKSFLVSQKVTDIVRDADFPVKELINKWGAPDHITFPRLLRLIREERREPYLKIFLTLSSHEPFDVPMQRFDDPYINSIAYTDSCLGVFLAELRETPAWDNLLLVLVPDHFTVYPRTIQYNSPERHEIFMIWAGGALKNAGTVDRICSQIDFASTLLSQMQIDASPFIFSRNIFDPHYEDFAFYDFPNGFGTINTSGAVVYDCNSHTIVRQDGLQTDRLLLRGKAFLQKLYDDIERR
jgi:phosphoglycerol transferase MdoB-like AlkP superfamily enzyme